MKYFYKILYSYTNIDTLTHVIVKTYTDIYTKIINSNFQCVKHQKHFSVTYFLVFTLLVTKKNLSMSLEFHSSALKCGISGEFQLQSFKYGRVEIYGRTVGKLMKMRNCLAGCASWQLCQLKVALKLAILFAYQMPKKIKRIK